MIMLRGWITKKNIYYSPERKTFSTENNNHELTSNVCFQPISVKCKENYLDRKYRLLGGPAENASLSTISQIMKLTILFHLQILGAGHHIPSFLNFCIIKF